MYQQRRKASIAGTSRAAYKLEIRRRLTSSSQEERRPIGGYIGALTGTSHRSGTILVEKLVVVCPTSMSQSSSYYYHIAASTHLESFEILSY